MESFGLVHPRWASQLGKKPTWAVATPTKKTGTGSGLKGQHAPGMVLARVSQHNPRWHLDTIWVLASSKNLFHGQVGCSIPVFVKVGEHSCYLRRCVIPCWAQFFNSLSHSHGTLVLLMDENEVLILLVIFWTSCWIPHVLGYSGNTLSFICVFWTGAA